MATIGHLLYPHVVEYSYRLLGFFSVRSMTIVSVERFSGEEVLKKAVEKKTGRKVIKIISYI